MSVRHTMTERLLPLRQRGFTTLVTTLVLLLLTVLVAYYTAAGAIMEQRMAANQVRSKQALLAAQAGIDQALDHMKKGGICQTTACQNTATGGANATTPDLLTPVGFSASSSTYKVAYGSPTVALPVCPSSSSAAFPPAGFTYPSTFEQVMIYSCGWSDDSTAVHRITVIAAGTRTQPSNPNPVPLISLGTANLLTGGVSILNYFNDMTIWTGASMLGQSATGKTFIRDTTTAIVPDPTFNYRNTGNSPSCNNPPTGYVCSTKGSTIGLDVIQGDTNLSTLTVPQLFQGVMGAPEATWRDTVAAYRIDLTGTLTNADSTSISFLNSAAFNSSDSNGSVWVEGSTSISGTVGSANAPKIIVINGDLTLGSNAVINGNIFVTGKVTTNGTPTIYGTLTVGDSTNTTGNMNIIYDPYTKAPSGGTTQLGAPTKLAGSWKDW